METTIIVVTIAIVAVAVTPIISFLLEGKVFGFCDWAMPFGKQEEGWQEEHRVKDFANYSLFTN